jgi:hypothetical protein
MFANSLRFDAAVSADLQFNASLPPLIPVEVFKEVAPDCDFEDGACGWKNVVGGDDDFDWAVNSGVTPTSGTGPSLGNALVDASSVGHYLLFVATGHANAETATFESPVFRGVSTCKMQFYWHMYVTPDPLSTDPSSFAPKLDVQVNEPPS